MDRFSLSPGKENVIGCEIRFALSEKLASVVMAAHQSVVRRAQARFNGRVVEPLLWRGLIAIATGCHEDRPTLIEGPALLVRREAPYDLGGGRTSWRPEIQEVRLREGGPIAWSELKIHLLSGARARDYVAAGSWQIELQGSMVLRDHLAALFQTSSCEKEGYRAWCTGSDLELQEVDGRPCMVHCHRYLWLSNGEKRERRVAAFEQVGRYFLPTEEGGSWILEDEIRNVAFAEGVSYDECAAIWCTLYAARKRLAGN